MRNGQLLFSAIQFFLIIALFTCGVALFGLHSLPGVRLRFAEWIIEPSMSFFFLGTLVTAIAFVLTLSFWIMQRGSFVRIEMKKLSIHEDLIRKAVDAFWVENDWGKPRDVYCKSQKIEIIAEAKDLDLSEIEEKLGEFLSKQFGYDRKFYVTLRSHSRNIGRDTLERQS